MAQATIINKFGRITGWNNLTVRCLGRNLEGIDEFEYDDNVDMENEYGSGKFPLGYSEGNYKATCSITLYSEEMVALVASLPKGARIQDIPPFPVVSLYDRNGVLQKDIVQNCKFKNNGRKIKQADGKILHKITVLTSHIDWNK